jgi:lambda family phage portal protein
MFDRFTRKTPKSSVSVRSGSVRSYNAATQTARFADFRGTGNSADAELSAALSTLRSKVRSLERNSGLIRRYLQLLQENVVGENGLSFQCKVRMLNGKLDLTLNTKIEKEWDDFWARPTVDRVMTGVDLLNQAVSCRYRDGEVFWEIVPSRDAPHGVLINPLEADMIDETINTVNPVTKNQIRMGVEIAASGAHVAYWVLLDHPGDTFIAGSTGRARHRRVSAESIIHWYEPSRPGQTRGEPPAVAAMNPIKMIDGYREAEVTMRRLKAAVMGFFQRVMPKADGLSALADAPVASEEQGDLMQMSVTPGLLQELPAGLEFNEFSPGGAISDFDKADATFSKHIAVALGISDMSLAMNTAGVSYSAGRTITLEDRRKYRAVQQHLIRRLVAPVVIQWVKYRMLTTDIAPSRFALTTNNFVLRPQGWDWVDPMKDIKANQVALETGQTTIGAIAASRGIDPADAMSDLIEEIERFTVAGLTHPFVAATSKKMGGDVTKPVDDEDEDDEYEDDVDDKPAS